MSNALVIFPRERIDFGRLGLPVAHLSRDQRDLLELLIPLWRQGRARQRQAFLAAEMKCSTRTIIRLLKDLKELGEIRIEKANGATNLYGPTEARIIYWTAREESGREESPERISPADVGMRLVGADAAPVDNYREPVTASHTPCDNRSQVPVTTAPPDTPYQKNQSSNESDGGGARRTSRFERGERNARSQARIDEEGNELPAGGKDGRLLRRWNPLKQWGPGDMRLPQQRLKAQVISAHAEHSSVWVWSRKRDRYRRLMRVAMSSDNSQMILSFESDDSRRREVGATDDITCPSIMTTSLWIGTDRWGNTSLKREAFNGGSR